jgi:hypothetical protein
MALILFYFCNSIGWDYIAQLDISLQLWQSLMLQVHSRESHQRNFFCRLWMSVILFSLSSFPIQIKPS